MERESDSHVVKTMQACLIETPQMRQ